jgi:hypothetical protein
MTIIALDPICKPLLGEPIEPLTINTVF